MNAAMTIIFIAGYVAMPLITTAAMIKAEKREKK